MSREKILKLTTRESLEKWCAGEIMPAVILDEEKIIFISKKGDYGKAADGMRTIDHIPELMQTIAKQLINRLIDEETCKLKRQR